MSKPLGSLSAGPACEAGKLIVQVIGKDHPDSQKLLFCDNAGMAFKASIDEQEHELYSSVLHAWDYMAQSRLELEIATTDGKPIRLPLLDDLQNTPRQPDAQFNQLVPIIPFVALPGSKNRNDSGTPILARAGFLYVFYRQKLWRELEIRIAANRTTYHDIDVARYRQGESFLPDERKAIGQALDDIWLPAIWNNVKVKNLQLCFSEIQLNAPRLKRLEQDSSLRALRCTNPDLYCSKARFKELYKNKPDGKFMLEAFSSFDMQNAINQRNVTLAKAVRYNLDLMVFPVSLAAPQRSREPGYEWLLDQPALYLCDLSGQFPVHAYQQAKDFLAYAAKGVTLQDTLRLELTAVTDALLASLPGSTAQEPHNPVELWAAQANVSDVLANARRRQICGVLLEDPRYRLRHLQRRIETHTQLFGLCARRAMQHPHHSSALLVQHLIAPRTIQGQPNPLHEGMTRLSETGKRNINCSTATVERTQVWQHMSTAQELVALSLSQASTQQTLADHLSLNGFDYVSALFELSRTLAAIALTPAQLDPLANGRDLTDAVTGVGMHNPEVSKSQNFLGKIVDTPQSPLHAMLWPVCNPQTVYEAYKIPDKEDENSGDGRFRATELAKHENLITPSPVNQATLDSVILSNLLAGDNLMSFLWLNSGKGISAALVSIFENLQGALDKPQSHVGTVRKELLRAEIDAEKIKKTNNNANDLPEKAGQHLGASELTVNIDRQSLGLQQLRSMLPKTFGPTYFMQSRQINQGHYVFGLEDLPTRQALPNTHYGEFLDSQGNRLNKNDNPRISSNSGATGEHRVLVIPRNHNTAKLISQMNQQLTAAQEAAYAAQSHSPNAQQGLGRTLSELNENITNSSYRILASSPFCVGVLMLEMWNVSSETQAWEQNSREKKKYRLYMGVIGAGVDLLVAMEALTIKLSGTASEKAITRKTLFHISEEGATRWLGGVLGARFTKKLSARLILQSFSGLILASVNLYDAWHSWQWNDRARYGYLMMSMGGIASTAAGLLKTMTTILGLGPLGWLALLLIVGGAGLVFWLNSTPLQTWLENGPFAESNSIARHLQDPKEAFYRLISLLAGISIDIQRNPAYELEPKLDLHAEVPYRVRTSNTLIRLKSYLPGMIGSLGTIDIQADCRVCLLTQSSNNQGVPYTSESELPQTSEKPVAQRLYPDALELYFSTSHFQPLRLSDTKSQYFKWYIRAQFVLSSDGEKRYFPAPPVKDPTQYSPNWARPDFRKISQPFWADEITHQGPAQ